MDASDPIALKFAWFSPSRGDADWAGAPAHLRDRRDGMAHLLRVARQAEANGFDSILIPICDECVDPLLVASAILHATSRLETIVAARALASSPVPLVKSLVTLSWHFPRRVALNLVPGNLAEASPEVRAWPTDKRDRYLGEAAAVVATLIRTGTWQGEQAEFFPTRLTSGVQDIAHTPSDLILGGHSAAAFASAAKYYDYLFMFADAAPAIARNIDTAQRHAQQVGRPSRLEFGMGVNIICRPTREQAVDVAHETLRQIGNSRIASHQSGADDTSLFITDTLWMGLGTVRKGPIASIVGSYDQVAAALFDYVRGGISYFSLTGHSYHEEAARVGQEILPRMRSLCERREPPDYTPRQMPS